MSDSGKALRSALFEEDGTTPLNTGGTPTWDSITGKPLFGTAATTDASAYATAAQGAKADSAVQATRTVAGHALSADVTVSKADVGLGSCDNTADADKPVSTAQATALGLKLNANDASVTNARPASDVAAWAKAPAKPSYTAAEVGADAVGAAAAITLAGLGGLTHAQVLARATFRM